MKKIFIIGFCLLVSGFVMSQSLSTVKTKPKITKVVKAKTVKAKVKPVAIKALLGDTIKEVIALNNTGIKIFLDSLTAGSIVDTTIKKGRRLTKYSFTPSVNTWAQTDTSYRRRYFLTIDVNEILTDKPDDVIDKNVLILNKEILEDQQRIQDKIRARNQALKLKGTN